MSDLIHRGRVEDLLTFIHVDCEAEQNPWAIQELRELGDEGVELICEVLSNGSNVHLRQQAAAALIEMTPRGESAKLALMDALDELYDEKSSVTLEALEKLRLPSADSTEELLAALQHSNPRIRAYAAIALRSRGCEPDAIISALTRAINDDDSAVRFTALASLIQIAKHRRTPDALPTMLASVRGDTWALKAVLVAIVDWCGLAAIPALNTALASESADIREWAGVLSRFSMDVDQVGVKELTLCAKDPDEKVRIAAIDTLNAIGEVAVEICESVSAVTREAQNDGNSTVRVRSELAYERLRTGLKALANPSVSIADILVRPAGTLRNKRQPGELEKSLLALLDTCVEWNDEMISERMIHASAALRAKRRERCLEEEVSKSTVRNHLNLLARMCELDSLTVTDDKRQASKLKTGVKDKLRDLRSDLEEANRNEEESGKKRQAKFLAKNT